MNEQQTLFSDTKPEPRFGGETFDAAASQQAKEQGMALAAENNHELLDFVRTGLVEIARSRPDRSVTADDAARYLVDNGFSVHALGNAAGSLFKDGKFTPTGATVKSVRKHAHSNKLMVWRLKR